MEPIHGSATTEKEVGIQMQEDFEIAKALVEKWKHDWMRQPDGYFDRAFGIDANMKHDLAERIAKHIEAERNQSFALQKEVNRLSEELSIALDRAKN